MRTPDPKWPGLVHGGAMYPHPAGHVAGPIVWPWVLVVAVVFVALAAIGLGCKYAEDFKR